MNIAIIEASGTDHERKLAKAISPILKRRHLLLVTLLIGNATGILSDLAFLQHPRDRGAFHATSLRTDMLHGPSHFARSHPSRQQWRPCRSSSTAL
jgi:hypothetical protein